ncbi:DUF3293 domain-containing protein [Shewanella schlegeliana]|uniref:DUF3293 domain-containing protein n=1 Tax=Shewanella schlegeliana TaxID=190308 RepID=A0ABS1SVU6_9GAMM|nr:DUF3293 domain-containing protein [Shewanella schlegeliana]MBL4912475.1 DUF3293 domain-containing protein [Shewanella schlegeliana]MCL1108055.1 DUF3293 domain-containing protein [Shewanella schlegeliana]GIU21595.1 hypothetical protein TUM4433_01140 [Shewanella schlegeliana]
MNDSVETLWRYYKETEFLLTQSLSSQLSFAIITAHNPRGEVLTPCQNGLLDRQLQHEIYRLGLPYRAMIGSSQDRKHMEKSWVVATDKASAIELGRLFNQNAIYYVEADKLQLVPCLLAKEEAFLGAFSLRVNRVQEFPDIV